jgi:hypothetical protein
MHFIIIIIIIIIIYGCTRLILKYLFSNFLIIEIEGLFYEKGMIK